MLIHLPSDFATSQMPMFFACRVWLGEHVYGALGDSILPAGYRISSKRVAKLRCKTPELEGHRFALANTRLPVPRIYRTHTWRGHLAIEMEYIPHCETLQQCWRTLSSEEKLRIVHQVSEYIQQLRSIKPPPESSSKVSSAGGGACRDIRISNSNLFGPFDDVAGFHCCVRNGVKPENIKEIFGENVADIHNRSYTICFTHGDLGPQNILVRDSKVAAIIDWECSGWYPEYWEYTKAHYNSVLLPEFYEMLRQHVPQYNDELAAERTLWQLYDQPLDQPLV